jgi:predicted adenylyl cyclase CyaB
MPANIEIKARVEDLTALRAAAESLCDGPAELLCQEDHFFSIPDGRLKLRILGDGRGELISYRRADAPGPRPSHYLIAPIGDPAALKEILAPLLGVLGVVRKRRWLYRAGGARIHLDRVEGLGDFVEVEVVLRPGQPEDDAILVARRLMERLGIAGDQLVGGAYLDLLGTES